MRNYYHIFIWKKAPFLRLLIPVISGIVLQFYVHTPISSIAYLAIISAILLSIFSLLPASTRFRFQVIQGLLISLILILLGSYLEWHKDIRNDAIWYGKFRTSKKIIIATITEPLQEKAKSFKAVVNSDAVIVNGKEQETTGKFLVYFSKDSTSQKLKYGDRIIVNKVLSPILNSGNPASFDYKQYCAFHQLYHQVYLKENEWTLLPAKNKNRWYSFIFSIREKVVSILDKYLGKTNESSIAKALLIGYKVDLDKDLVQAYSNAGVVHIIAISGLHMGIIYAILLWLFSMLPFAKKSKLLRLILILAGLWIFAILTGASPSVVRAALMFSFIIVGNAFSKTGSVYNSIAASAFFLLCFNPFILWDAGFQLSYLAVLGIVVAQKPIANWFYFENKLLQKSWQLAAVSLSAQLFTLPLSLYYFHQLPLIFLLSNHVAIPLATLVLCGCLILIVISPITIAAFYFAKIVFGAIWLLNHSVLFFNSIPYSLWTSISISVIETFLLYLIITSAVFAFIRKNKTVLKYAMALLLCFVSFKTFNKWQLYHQKKIIVYNIPRHKAVEFIDRNNFFFSGDTEVVNDKLLNSYNLKPVQIAFQLKGAPDKLNHFFSKNNFYQFYNSRILMIDSSFTNYKSGKKVKVNYILISKNPRIKIADVAENFDCKNYIADASNPPWKIEQWKKECEELHLHFHSVSEQGAFVINL